MPPNSVLAQFREAATSNRDPGDRFARLLCCYLELDPIHAERLFHGWRFNEWLWRGKIGHVAVDAGFNK